MVMLPNIIMLALFIAAAAALQIFLSRRESRWPGLILPVIPFLVSILYIVNALNLPGAVTGFLLANIPTVVLLGIYFACRENRRKKKQLEKMNIQDLD